MAKLLKYAGNITVEQEAYPIASGTLVAGNLLVFASGGVTNAAANAPRDSIAGICEGIQNAEIGDSASTAIATGVGVERAIVRNLLSGTIVEVPAAAALALGVGVAVSGANQVAAVGANPLVGYVVKVVSASPHVVQIRTV